LRTVRAGRPPVGSLDIAVHRDRDTLLEQHHVQHVGIIGIEPVPDWERFEAEVTMQCARGAPFVTFRITQQYERLFRRVVQPGVKLRLPESVVCHVRLRLKFG
jgi:hypothetical protein